MSSGSNEMNGSPNNGDDVNKKESKKREPQKIKSIDEIKMSKQEQYNKRLQELKDAIKDIDLNTLEITPEDLKDPFCDPEHPVTIEFNHVSAAAYRLKGGIENTPCTRSHMSQITGMEYVVAFVKQIFFKKDFLQYTGSFKDRGARYALLALDEEQKSRGVIAASAGNHALALCYNGKQLGIPVVCVMPKIAPIMKVSNCQSYGAAVLVYGNDLGEVRTLFQIQSAILTFNLKVEKICNEVRETIGLQYINGYDHPNILAGQGTMALEILEQVQNLDAIVVPTGGAGLLAGIAVATKAMNPNVLIIAAESEKCASFKTAMDNYKPTYTKSESTLADGLAVPTVGVNAFASACKLVDKCVVVKEEFIAIAILRLLELEKAVVEGAGACGFAAVLQGLLPELKGKRVAIPLCGGNIDTTILGRVLERGLVADGRMIKVWVTISDRPGGLAELCKLFASKGASVKDMYHERAWVKNDMFTVQIQVILEVRDAENAREVERELRKTYDQVIIGTFGTN